MIILIVFCFFFVEKNRWFYRFLLFFERKMMNQTRFFAERRLIGDRSYQYSLVLIREVFFCICPALIVGNLHERCDSRRVLFWRVPKVVSAANIRLYLIISNFFSVFYLFTIQSIKKKIPINYIYLSYKQYSIWTPYRFGNHHIFLKKLQSFTKN